MSNLHIGDIAPDFTLPADGDTQVNLSDYRGRKLVLYFYPKDNTPGCTTESCDFRDAMEEFNDLGVAIVGISKCSVTKHDNFKAKHDLNFPLASDENNDVCERYGCWAEKSMYGKKFWGIERSTFLIDETGKIEKIWRKVKVKDHIEDVRAALAS